jgi:hypothetical protein
MTEGGEGGRDVLTTGLGGRQGGRGEIDEKTVSEGEITARVSRSRELRWRRGGRNNIDP